MAKVGQGSAYPPNEVDSGGKKLPVLPLIGLLCSLIFPVPVNEFENVFQLCSTDYSAFDGEYGAKFF